MNQFARIMLVFGALSAATAEDLSKYRNFQLGSDLSTIAKLAGANPSQAKVIHSRPSLMQELVWRPQPLGSSLAAEPAKEVVFSFCDGELYAIAVSYDRYETEGLTADDLIDAISSTYGISAKPTAPATVVPPSYGEQEKVLAQWQDSQYRFSLNQSAYGSSFSLVGILKRLEAPVQAAIIESKRLDDKEAPQREVERIARDHDAERARLEQARLVNKPKFRP